MGYLDADETKQEEKDIKTGSVKEDATQNLQNERERVKQQSRVIQHTKQQPQSPNHHPVINTLKLNIMTSLSAAAVSNGAKPA